MMVLAVTSLLTYLEPAVCLKACDQILNFRWHRARMLLAKLRRRLSRSLFFRLCVPNQDKRVMLVSGVLTVSKTESTT